jgi:transcriptional regulator with XRE-family HTH domain
MSKKATKALNNRYYIARYNASKNDSNFTSREKTAEILNIDRTRLSRIELGTVVPYPEEVLAMAQAYDLPELCNVYCSADCAIGRETVKPINADSLDRLILQFLGSSQKMEDITEQLIEITEDGIVDETEIAQFDTVLAELEKMSINIQSLMLWARKNKEALKNKKNE